jgi:hypothetical protein
MKHRKWCIGVSLQAFLLTEQLTEQPFVHVFIRHWHPKRGLPDNNMAPRHIPLRIGFIL